MNTVTDLKSEIINAKDENGNAIRVRYYAPDRLFLANEVDIIEAKDLNGNVVELSMGEKINIHSAASMKRINKYRNQ